MPKNPTKGSKQLAIEIDEELHQWLKDQAKADGRTLRGLVERALRLYRDTTPADPVAKSVANGGKRKQ